MDSSLKRNVRLEEYLDDCLISKLVSGDFAIAVSFFCCVIAKLTVTKVLVVLVVVKNREQRNHPATGQCLGSGVVLLLCIYLNGYMTQCTAQLERG